MIIREFINVSDWDPYIKTEETICNLLIRDKNMISDDYELIVLPLAHMINSLGVSYVNNFINDVSSDKKRVFICQHILVHNLIFKDTDIVFTPHSSTQDKFITIPHYAVSVDVSQIQESKKYLFSFLGSTTTHPTRPTLVNLYPRNCFTTNVHWGLEKKDDQIFIGKYIKLLGESTFSLCPRGTGISTVRIFEAMAMGSIPVIIADNYQPLLHDVIDWETISVLVNQGDITEIPNILATINHEDMLHKTISFYNKFLSNENLHMSVIDTLTK